MMLLHVVSRGLFSVALRSFVDGHNRPEWVVSSGTFVLALESILPREEHRPLSLIYSRSLSGLASVVIGRDLAAGLTGRLAAGTLENALIVDDRVSCGVLAACAMEPGRDVQ